MESLFGGLKISAPEFHGITGWINSKPLKLWSLKGRVVLIDFWSYTCINCIRTLPHIKKWHKKYSKKGLIVIGVHSPEFSFEKDIENVKKAVKEFGMKYPVAIDSDMKTWKAFDNHYWPAKFLIDKNGFIVYVHFGEGGHTETELEIQKELGLKVKTEKEKALVYLFDQSPETYAGFLRNTGLGSGLVCDEKGCNIYVDPGQHQRNVIYPNGQWTQEKEYLGLKRSPGKLSYKFNAREVNIVMQPVSRPVKADVYIDYRKTKTIKIDKGAMYQVFKDKKYKERDLGIIFHGKVRVYAFTFG